MHNVSLFCLGKIRCSLDCGNGIFSLAPQNSQKSFIDSYVRELVQTANVYVLFMILLSYFKRNSMVFQFSLHVLDYY